jgi:hypothetical protein
MLLTYVHLPASTSANSSTAVSTYFSLRFSLRFSLCFLFLFPSSFDASPFLCQIIAFLANPTAPVRTRSKTRKDAAKEIPCCFYCEAQGNSVRHRGASAAAPECDTNIDKTNGVKDATMHCTHT